MQGVGSKRWWAGGRQRLRVWHCCELLLNFRLSFWQPGACWDPSGGSQRGWRSRNNLLFTPGPKKILIYLKKQTPNLNKKKEVEILS